MRFDQFFPRERIVLFTPLGRTVFFITQQARDILLSSGCFLSGHTRPPAVKYDIKFSIAIFIYDQFFEIITDKITYIYKISTKWIIAKQISTAFRPNGVPHADEVV